MTGFYWTPRSHLSNHSVTSCDFSKLGKLDSCECVRNRSIWGVQQTHCENWQNSSAWRTDLLTWLCDVRLPPDDICGAQVVKAFRNRLAEEKRFVNGPFRFLSISSARPYFPPLRCQKPTYLRFIQRNLNLWDIQPSALVPREQADSIFHSHFFFFKKKKSFQPNRFNQII